MSVFTLTGTTRGLLGGKPNPKLTLCRFELCVDKVCYGKMNLCDPEIIIIYSKLAFFVSFTFFFTENRFLMCLKPPSFCF